MPADALKLMFVAGENSGDQHAARVIAQLRQLEPTIEVFGYGGDKMAEAGMRLVVNLTRDYAVIGITQAIRQYRALRRLLNQAIALIETERPDALVLVDYPGFNLRLAEVAKARGTRVFYYISPQVWAWHKSRIEKIRQFVDHIFVILPFEEEMYRRVGQPVTFVGHPLRDAQRAVTPRAQYLRGLNVDLSRFVIGLIPGSRSSEVQRLLPVMLDAAEIVWRRHPQTHFLVPLAGTVERSQLEQLIGQRPELPVTIVQDDISSAQAAMDFAICKSGTSTLELALADTPMVVVYRVSWITYAVAKTVVKIPWIGLVNIVADREIAPEFIQHAASPKRIASVVNQVMEHPEQLQNMRADLAAVRARLGDAGASRKAAAVILDLLRPAASAS